MNVDAIIGSPEVYSSLFPVSYCQKTPSKGFSEGAFLRYSLTQDASNENVEKNIFLLHNIFKTSNPEFFWVFGLRLFFFVPTLVPYVQRIVLRMIHVNAFIQKPEAFSTF